MRNDKLKAINLRKRGLSYNEISRELAIPKSTLSGWFQKIPFSAEMKKRNISRLKKILAKNITDYNKKRSKRIRGEWLMLQKKSSQTIKTLSRRELMLVGAALYWAEGYKKTNWNLSFSNSDPQMIKVIMVFFRTVCSVPQKKFRVQMQLYHNHLEGISKKFWSKITKIPECQFTKTIYQTSSASKLKRGNTLPHGTIRIRVNDVNLVNTIKGWISGLSKSM